MAVEVFQNEEPSEGGKNREAKKSILLSIEKEQMD